MQWVHICEPCWNGGNTAKRNAEAIHTVIERLSNKYDTPTHTFGSYLDAPELEQDEVLAQAKQACAGLGKREAFAQTIRHALTQAEVGKEQQSACLERYWPQTQVSASYMEIVLRIRRDESLNDYSKGLALRALEEGRDTLWPKPSERFQKLLASRKKLPLECGVNPLFEIVNPPPMARQLPLAPGEFNLPFLALENPVPRVRRCRIPDDWMP